MPSPRRPARETSRRLPSERFDLSHDDEFRASARDDWERTAAHVSLDTSPETAYLLLGQTISGHAQEGHGCFSRRYLNATIGETIAAAGEDAEHIRQRREGVLQDIEALLSDALHANGELPLRNTGGETIAGLNILDQSADPMLFLWGFYVAGAVMDNRGWRERMAAWTKRTLGKEFNVHTGDSYPVSLAALEGRGVTLDSLAKGGRVNMDGLALPENPALGSRDVVSAYVQNSVGTGGSDDASLVYIGMLYGRDAMAGAFLADHVDTLDKYCALIYHGGRDQLLADSLLGETRFLAQFGPDGRDWLREEVLFPFLLFGNKSPVKRLWDAPPKKVKFVQLPSSSQSYFQRVRESGLTAIEAHMEYATNGTVLDEGLPIAFEKMPYFRFAEELENRIAFFTARGLFPSSEMRASWF